MTNLNPESQVAGRRGGLNGLKLFIKQANRPMSEFMREQGRKICDFLQEVNYSTG